MAILPVWYPILKASTVRAAAAAAAVVTSQRQITLKQGDKNKQAQIRPACPGDTEPRGANHHPQTA